MSNVQLSTFNGVTEKGHGGRDMGTDTVLGTGGANRGTDTTFGPGGWTFDPLDLSKRLSGGRGCPGTPGFGDRHDVRYADSERSTCNVQLSTFNGVAERSMAGVIWGQTRYLGAGGANRGTDTTARRDIAVFLQPARLLRLEHLVAGEPR